MTMNYERNQQPYYYSERSYNGPPPFETYHGPPPPPIEKEVHLEYHKPRMGPCMIVLAIMFILFVVILVICLIIFFTWGASYRPNGNGTTGKLSDKGGYLDLETTNYILNGLKTSRKICLLDTTNDVQRYNDEHIPGARRFDISKVTKKGEDGGFNLSRPLDFQTYARSLGIDNDCQVITYDHSETNNSIKTSTYVWLLFKLYGHKTVSVMHGGLKEWKKLVTSTNEPKYLPVSTSSTSSKTEKVNGDFDAKWDPQVIFDYADIENAVKKGKSQIVDSRSPGDYNGKGTTPKDPDAKEPGRIRGSLNAPTEEMMTSNGTLKNLPDLRKWMSSKNMDPSRPSIVYDNRAMDASALYFVMIQAGYDVKLYNGGWVEFSYKAPKDLKTSG